jgi:choline kinase/thiamine kinase-like enzyme
MISQVVIPSAGIGSRLGNLTEHVNKAMIQIDGKAIISHILSLYPPETEFIICLGHKGNFLRQYLEISHPELNFQFVEIDNYKGPKSGLGHTLKQTKNLIKGPFYFHTNDAIFLKKIPKFDKDTIVLSTNNIDSRDFRTVSLYENNMIVNKFFDKTNEKLENVFTYTGVAFIKNYLAFKEFLDDISVEIGESDYFIKKIGGETSYYLADDWIDIGSINGINNAKENLGGFKNLSKTTEEIYFINDNVIKFDKSSENLLKKVTRNNLLKKIVPQIESHTENFFSYKYKEGELMADLLSPHEEFNNLLNWCEHNLWIKPTLNKSELSNFKNNTKKFYYEKTYDRINLFQEEFEYFDNSSQINGKAYPKLDSILRNLNWDIIYDSIPCTFHGDLHFENILKTKDGFTLIDWRSSYGDLVEFGDLYYDLGKLLHGLWINHKIIRDNHFEISITGTNIMFDIYQKKSLVECEAILREHAEKMNYSWNKIQTIAALILLNIAPLHHDPYAKLLYFYGKEKLLGLVENQ